ncbi:MAG: HD-GYP domain-containing protein [Candidatus Sumerlaeaceae bacterium]
MDPQKSVRFMQTTETAPAPGVMLQASPNHTPFPFSTRASALLQKQLKLIEELAAAHDLPPIKNEECWTGIHTTRVAEIAALLAQLLKLPEGEISLIRRAAPLHDLGKLAIPAEILQKPSSLNEEEFAIVKTHTTLGERLLLKAGVKSRLLTMAGEIARTHHEHWDGSGYPHGLRGEDIPLTGRIVSVADVYDALTRTRPYKARWTSKAALEAIVQRRGSKFDPMVVDALLSLHESGSLDVSPAISN